ncbi:MAG: plasmid pRiA4b ORF-3 family protein [Deltaproteobacteria bacterium]|nr:plasmid pRiA4b ORF-3 family protein [Deltaproteobacteria bacterium]
MNLPTWVIGAPLESGIEAPAYILKVWPSREPVRCLRPSEFNPELNELQEGHCALGTNKPVIKRHLAVVPPKQTSHPDKDHTLEVVKKKPKDVVNIYRLKVTLQDSKPPIWRRFEVLGNITLRRLHKILQIVMGWDDYHLHQFIVGYTHYGEPDPDYDTDDLQMKNDKSSRLYAVVPREKATFLYEYDFGDSWIHEILVEKILPREEGKDYPVCLAGKRACPPENVGGIWRYGEYLEAFHDRDHPEHEQVLAWRGLFDPEVLDLAGVNVKLKKLK